MKEYTAPEMEIVKIEEEEILETPKEKRKIEVWGMTLCRSYTPRSEQEFYLYSYVPNYEFVAECSSMEEVDNAIYTDNEYRNGYRVVIPKNCRSQKERRSENRRLDAKLKVKNFYTKKNLKKSKQRREQSETYHCPGRLHNAMDREMRSTKNNLHEIITSFNCNPYYRWENAVGWEDRNYCNSAYWQGYYKGFNDGAADPEWYETYERCCDASDVQETALAEYRAFAQGYCDGWRVGRSAACDGIQALYENKELENIFIKAK